MIIILRSRLRAVRVSKALALAVLIIAVFPDPRTCAQGGVDETDAVAMFNRAQDLHEKGDLRGALELYGKALLALPEFPEAAYQQGTAFLAIRDLDAAEKSFRRAVELKPGWSLAMNSLGSLLIQRGKAEEALSLLNSVLETDPYNPSTLSALAELQINAGAPSAALRQVLEKIVVLTSKSNLPPFLWTSRAALESALGLKAAAKASLGRALASNPLDPSALLLLGDMSLADGDIDKARAVAGQLADRGSLAAPALVLKAKVLAFEGRFDEALAALDKIIDDVSGVASLRKRINNSRSTSTDELERQLKGNESDIVILGRLCYLYRRANPAKALDYCRRASTLEPNNIGHAVGFGAALVQSGQFERAAELLTRIVKVAPENATARANLATSLFQLHRYPEAKAEFLWLAHEQPRSAGAFYFLAIVHDQMSEYMDAAANYQRYLELANPSDNKTDIEKVELRLPQIRKLIREGKGKKNP